MRKVTALILFAALILCGCSAKSSIADEKWVVPAIEAAPTVPPTPTPEFSGSGYQPEAYIWNEAESFNMSDPGVAVAATQSALSHSKSFSLFEGQFLPGAIFNESYAGYAKRSLQKTEHQVLTDESGALAEHAYVEYKYLPSNRNEDKGITVMAELCSYDAVVSAYERAQYPHIFYPDGLTPLLSSYYLNSFVLSKLGDVRYAQWMILPSAFFSYADSVLAAAEDAGETPAVQRQVLLTFSCGAELSDEEFIQAVCAISQYAAANRTLPSNVKPTPAPGEKGAA